MSTKIFPNKPNAIKKIFNTNQAVIGMIHLKPLPGSPHFKGGTLDPVYDFAMSDIKALEEGGVDGLIIENAWDIPFSKPDDIGMETVAALASLIERFRKETNLPIGINTLANGAISSLAVAKATNIPFIRVNQWVNAYVANEGIIEGASAKALRYRSNIKGDDIKIFADVHVKHGSHSIVADRSLADQTHDAVFFDADVLIATGSRTGNETSIEEVSGIKAYTDLPVIIGSGMGASNVEELLPKSNGCIVGSSLKQDGLWWNPVDIQRVKEFMNIVFRVRSGGGISIGK